VKAAHHPSAWCRFVGSGLLVHRVEVWRRAQKKPSLRLRTMYETSNRPVRCRTSSLDTKSCHLMCRMRLWHRTWNESSLFQSTWTLIQAEWMNEWMKCMRSFCGRRLMESLTSTSLAIKKRDTFIFVITLANVKLSFYGKRGNSIMAWTRTCFGWRSLIPPHNTSSCLWNSFPLNNHRFTAENQSWVQTKYTECFKACFGLLTCLHWI